MKFALIAGLIALAAAPIAQADTPAADGPVCLRSMNISNTSVPDDRTILFHMNDGTVWRNDLKNSCPQLKFNGFAYLATPPDELCGNLQTIRVLRGGSVCLLGPFTKVVQAPAKFPASP